VTLIYRAAGVSDTGLSRAHNEDTLLLDPDNGMVVVADGIGGRPGGEIASAMAVRAIQESLTNEEWGSAWGDRMARAVFLANQQIWSAASEDPTRAGMGTTVTALVLVAETERWIIGNVGDSRGYLLRDGKLRRVTRDHTVVQDLVESGALAPDATGDHPLGHLINRAVGTEGSVEADIFEGDAMSGDIFLLCTDGLVGLIMDDELEGLLQGLTSDGLEDKTAELIEMAHKRGAPDNVTVGFLALEEST